MDEKNPQKVKLTPPCFYAIYAQGLPNGPLSERQGFLTQEGRCLFYAEKEKAEQKVSDIRCRCVNQIPAASLKVVPFPGAGGFVDIFEVETINAFDLKPEFDPQECQAKTFAYGNTGGGCMVGTVSFYIPSLEKTVWVNCNDEGVSITATDIVWNEDNSDSDLRYADLLLFHAMFHETKPEELGIWLPAVKEALRYTMEQEIKYRRHPFTLPPQWQQLIGIGQPAQSQTTAPPEMTQLC